MNNINYREDQLPIIFYENGTMAVPAVPGAGKTFIVTNLVAKLLCENKHKGGKILILTYMNSAVNNFKGRIKKILHARQKPSLFRKLSPYNRRLKPPIPILKMYVTRI